MKYNIAIFLGLIVLAFAYTWYADFRQTPPPPAKTAPAFSFTALDGTRHSLDDYKGKTILLNFWATWCAPCVIEFPQMIELAKTDPGIVILFLSIDEDPAKIPPFLKKYGTDLPQNVMIGLDTDKSISKDLYQTYKIPETYLISPDMIVHEKIIGADISWTGAAMREKLKTVALQHLK